MTRALEPDGDGLAFLDVHGIDETHLAAAVSQDEAGGADTVAEVPHAIEQVEETVHYAMAQRPDARRVLLISVGVSGTAPGLLGQHGQGVQDGLAAIDADRILQAQSVDVPQQSLDSRAGIAAHQDPGAEPFG